jgi:DNA modification methylase
VAVDTLGQRYDPAFPIDQLSEHPDNPRRGDVDAIAASLDAHGFYGAVLVQASTRRIIAGNHRTRVARDRGATTVPVLWLDVDDDEAARLLLVDNRTADDAVYDSHALADLLASLSVTDAGLIGSGYDQADLARLLKRWATPDDPDDVVPEPPPEPRSALGDLWELGDHRLLCGSATSADDVDRLLDGITPRAMVTDPPYLVDYSGGNRSGMGRKDWSDTYHDPPPDSGFYVDFVREAVRHLHDECFVYQWHASKRADLVREAWESNGLLWHQTVYWVKGHAYLTREHFLSQVEPAAYGWRVGRQPPVRRRNPKDQPNLWQLDRPEDDSHPTVKPVQLVTDPYSWHLRDGEWAYEPFSGSGTAIAAAEVTGRRCAAMELQPAFVDVAVMRWQRITGRRPNLNGSEVDLLADVSA